MDEGGHNHNLSLDCLVGWHLHMLVSNDVCEMGWVHTPRRIELPHCMQDRPNSQTPSSGMRSGIALGSLSTSAAGACQLPRSLWFSGRVGRYWVGLFVMKSSV